MRVFNEDSDTNSYSYHHSITIIISELTHSNTFFNTFLIVFIILFTLFYHKTIKNPTEVRFLCLSFSSVQDLTQDGILLHLLHPFLT